MVKVVAEEVCACMSTVAIENGKETALGPSVALLLGRLLNVQDDGNSVFVIITNYALIGIGSIRLDNTVFLGTEFRLLEVGQLDV